MIAHNVALEVNTSTLEKAGFTLPSREVLALYRACGGRLLTLGSDAHDPKGLTRGFSQAKKLLRELGFTELCFHTASTLMHVPL
jgi:histidinol-phosphatase (PHP family)